MTDYNLVDPQSGWEYDLHSVYAAYIGHFQLHGTAWWDRTWGTFFTSFEAFLQFGWPCITITDVYEVHHRAHIVTTQKHIQTFLKMIRTRFGENLPFVENITQVRPFEVKSRQMRYVSDLAFYKKLHATLPAVALSAQKERIRTGDVAAIEAVWKLKEKNFLAVDFEWSEKNPSTCLEFGYAALRSSFVSASGVWPAVPENNFRMGHFIITEYLDVVVNKHRPTYPRAYSFGTSSYISKRQIAGIIQTVIDSLASPESETQSNDLVLVAHGVSGDLERLAELKIKIPNNVIILDTAAFERQLFRIGKSPAVLDPATLMARKSGHTLSLGNVLRALGVDVSQIVFHNSGNDAFAALSALQLLLEPSTKFKKLRKSPSSAFSMNSPEAKRISSIPHTVDVLRHKAPSPHVDVLQHHAPSPALVEPVVTVEIVDEPVSPVTAIRIVDTTAMSPPTPDKAEIPVKTTAGKGKGKKGRGGGTAGGQGKQGTQQKVQHVEDAMREAFME